MSNTENTETPVFRTDNFFGKVIHRLLYAPLGLGRPETKAAFEENYKNGNWDFLDSLQEVPNLMVVAGYIHFLSKELEAPARVFDMGCGSGNAAEILSKYAPGGYVGLDMTEEAVKRAGDRDIPNTEFRLGRFEDSLEDQEYDFIVCTGAIQYASNPAELLSQHSRNLSENGKFVISLWRRGSNSAIWRAIEKRFSVFDSTQVKNKQGIVWDIKVLNNPQH